MPMPFSPPQSVASSSSSSSPLTVKKLVLDGKSKSEGASFRMYLKVSVCIDNVQPGALFPLFPENNTRVLSTEVHPLDDRFSPYYFSPEQYPLIEKGVNSLQLPSMNSKSYMSLFHVNDPDTSRRHRGTDSTRCLAQVLVSAYAITLALPTEFPPFSRGDTGDSDDDETLRLSQHSQSTRRQSSSMFNRNHLNYVVAFELSLPFLSMPPRGPFLISIPVPRCLDNQLRMRVAVPPDSVKRVPRPPGDSTSSGDDMAGWDFLTDPPVTRRVSRFGARNGDEDHPSDHTSVTSGVEVIQGAFQSTDCLHVRWAPPLPRRSKPESGLWRVNMQTSTAIMKCQVLARNEATLKMGISYEAKCSELWHPGVATIVGLDVVLDAKRRMVSWPEEEHLKGWLVTVKDNVFVGIHKDVPQVVSRQSSLESSTFSSTFLPTLNQDSIHIPRGSASLLHAPLPSNNPPDYSFETSSPNGSPRHRRTMSVDTKDSLRTSKDNPPNAPFTLRINMHKLLLSTKNEFAFTVRGVILIKLDPETPEDVVPLPKFHVLGIHTQEVKTWVSMHIETNEIIYLDDEHPSEQGRRQLTTGKEVRCEEETVLIVPQSRALAAGSRSPRLSPNIGSANDSSSPSRRVPRLSRVSRNSPLAIRPPVQNPHMAGQAPEAFPIASTFSDHSKLPGLAHVDVSVTPLDRPLTRDRSSHRVKVTIPLHAQDSDMIRFGLATTRVSNNKSICPNVDLLYASYCGRQILANIQKAVGSDLELTASITTNQPNSQLFGEMQYSVSLDTSGLQPGLGTVDCVYLVDFLGTETQGSEKRATAGKEELDALLPCFNMPVLMYEVSIDSLAEGSYSLKSTTLNRDSSYASKFTQYHAPAAFYPSLRISMYSNSLHRWWPFKTLLYILGYTVFILFFSQLIWVSQSNWIKRDLHDVRSSVNAILYGLMNGGNPRSFLEGYYSANERNGDADRDWKYQENPVIFVSTVTTTFTVTQTYTLTPTVENYREDDAVRTIRLSEADTLVQPPRTTPTRSPPPPPPPSPISQETAGKELNTLARFHALSLPYFKLSFPDETKFVVKRLMKFMYFLRRVWNFPMDPD